MANSNNNNDWRSRVKAMMTDPKYAEKMASVVDNTRKVNTDLMNKSEELESSLSLDKPKQEPLDLARVGEMKAEDAARATMPSEESDYSGVSDLATKVYAEERNKRIGKAEQRSNAFSNAYVGAPQSMRFSQAMMDIRDVEKAKNVQGIYDKVLQDESVAKAIRINADKALSKAMEQNQSLSEEEQKKVYDDAVSKQLEAIGKGIDKYLYDINAPKSEAEWVAKNAVNSSIMGQMLTSPANVEGGENAYRQQALADYGAKASWLSQGVSMAGSLIIDTLPMMGIGTAFAAPASKAAMWGVGKVGGKALQGSLIGRGIVGSVGGAATLGGYNAASALTTQFSNGQFDLGEITSSAGHGALMGGLTGVMSPVLRGVSQGMGKVGKAATMAGGLGAEAGIFSAAELAEMDNPYDFETIAQTFGKNVVVIGGLKLSNPIKTIGEYKRWYNEGKQSNFDDADYKMMADFAKANGFANNEAFSMSADGVYSRSIADRVTGNRTLLELTKLEGGKERNLAIEMYNDPNVPISLKTKIAAKMNLPAPKPLLANGVRVEGNKAITYCTMPNGAQQVIEIKEFARPRNARAFANEFSRTTARKNDLMQTEAAVNNISTEPIVIARLNEQAKRNGTTYEEELARLNDIVQRAAEGTITAEDVAYYSSIVDTDISATEAIKQGIKDEYGVEIDDILKSDGNLTDVQDKALTAYADDLRGIVEQGNPTTERMLVASTSGVADYVALNRLGIEQTRQIMENPAQRAEIDAQMRSKYGAWLKYFDGKMGEDALAAKLGYDLNNSTDLQNFLAEQTYFKGKAADRIAANTTDVAKQLLEQGGRGVRFTEGGKVKLQGVPYPIEVSQEIVGRYDSAMQGSGEPMSRIVNDALKDIIKQSETPSVKEPIVEEMPDATEQPMTDADAVTQQMVDARITEIDTDLQGIEADGVQRMTIDGRPVAIIKGRIVADADGKVDKTKSSTEVAYMLLDENGRPILEDGKPKIEVGVKPSNVRVEDIEQWRSVDDYKVAEEQRIRDNNRLTDEAMQMADEQMRTEEMPAESKAEEITDPQTTDELLTLCKGDRELALDVAMDELNRAQQSKGKGANAAETMAINQRIRTYQRMVDDLSKVEEPTPTEAPTEQTTDAQVTDDMEFIYQKDLGENHDGMEPMQLADGRYKWVGLQRGELTATMGERDAELLDGLAKKLGVAIIPIDVADSAVNGYYRDGNIYVNTNRGAEWTMRWVAGHEMLHDVAKKSPEAYDAYKQAVLNMWDSSYIDNQVKQIIDDYAASGKTIDREQALTELVNDFGGELFNSRDGLSILDNILKGESHKGNTGFVETIKQWWEKLKEWFGGTPYYNEAQKMLEQAYKDAMQNVDYKAREEQLSKDMDDAFFGETEVVKPREVETELKETKDYTPTKMPSGTTIEDKPSGDFSIKSIMRGVGIDAQTDGDNVWFEKDGKRYSKDVPMTIEESKSGILKDMVDQCVELGLMDEAKSKDVYKMYTGIVNKIIEKADGSFADLNNQYLWLGETVYRVVHSNSDKQYKRSLDVTLVCKKNEAVIRGISELQRRQGFGVTPAQIMQLYYSTLEKGYQVPCPVCYVFSRYIQNGQYTSNLMYGHSLYDNNPYFRNPAEMTPEQKAAAEAYWLKEYKRVLKDEEKNKKLIDACKSVMSWATKEMDKLMLEATTGANKAAKRKEYEKRAAKLDEYYRAAINLVAKADMSGYITSVITKPIVKDKKVVGMEMREDAGQKLTPEVEEAILDFRKVALAKTKYPHIARYIASKGSAAGKGYNFESDNPMGDVLQQLSTDAKNNYQEAMNATTDKERAKVLNEAKKKTMNSARYAARQTLRGGIRQWSWSDNIEALAPDVALNAMQVGMLGGAMQTYSKQLEGIEMMAAMNAYVNGSLMGYGMGYQKVSADFKEAPKWQDPKTGGWYTLHFDDVVGVQPYNRNGKLGLFALNEMYDRAGNILVGMNDVHIRTAMADPRIFFIIPWHASGMSDHILKQMNSMLKLDMAGFKASDYTKHQEEKMYENKLKKQKDENGVEIEVEEIEKIPESTAQLWQTHDYSEKFLNRDGTQPKIELADGQLSADQLHYRELRDAVLMYSNAEDAGEKDKAFWAEHQDWLAEIKNDIFLNQVLESVTNGPGKFGIAMTTEDCGFVYPYEYWDKTSTYNGADVNGQRYVEYCRRLGVKPKFSGIDGKAGVYGNFVDDSGYWKLLIDRRMYDREGNYQDLTPVDISGFKADFIDQDKTAARFPVTVVADKEATSKIVDDVQYNELKVYNDNPLEVDYEQTIKEALKEAKKAEEKYIKAKQAIQITKTGKQKVVNQSELYKLELDRLANKEALADVENDNFLADEGAEMSIVRDRNKIEELEGEELVPMFRTFQILDDALYSPMATVQRGEKVHSVAEGDWWKSDENPDLAKVRVKGSSTEFYDKDDDRIGKKDGQWVITIDGEDKPLSANGNALSYYFLLKKGEKGDVVDDELYAAYNPYIHASRSSLNDQFKGAYLRPNLVLVEVLVPKSEIDGTNRYKADYAKDSIGEVDWNSGSVIKQAVAAGHPGRKVALSRYAKIGKVFSNAEWAKKIDEELSAYKEQITLPFVAFPPEVLRELANMGYKVEPPTSKKAQPYYEAWLKGEQPTDSNGGGGKPIDAEFSIKPDKQKQLDIINRTNPAHDDYHTWIRTTDDIKTLQEAVDEVKAEDADYNLSTYPDVTDNMIDEALQSGKITIYSSKPIKEGAFVSPSKMQAKDYAGGGRIYSKQVPINDVAWINTDEGMFAPVEFSVKGKRANESVLDYAKRVSEETGKKNLLNGGSYFSGGGLLEEGLKGFVDPRIAVEYNKKVAGVYRNNFGEHIVIADVRDVDPTELIKGIDGPVAYFHASPVCKNFSKAKRNAEELPLDKETAQSTAKFISEVRPKIVTIENVKGYRNSEAMKIILDELEKQGYNYDADTYNAADYGAYTSRERLIVRAVRDWPLPPKPIKMLADERPSGWLEAVADLIDGLPQTKNGVPDWMDVRLKAMGIDYRNIDKPLYVFGSGYSKDRIGCAFSDELVPALRTKGGDIIIMPDGRVLKATPRVLARISGMSDDYVMPKTDDLAHTIVGNGIPVQLTKAVMGSLIENVKSDLDAGNTEYSIIGKRGAANLDKRDETSIRVDNMVTAEEMEKAGKDAKTIRMATGWERGADGKWRYEIADAKLLPWEVWSKKRTPKLKDIVENADELFAAYPELKDIKVKKSNGKDLGGSFANDVITLEVGLMKTLEKYGSTDDILHGNKTLNSTLIHEIQHYIQDAEGFAQGGSSSTVIDGNARKKIKSLIDEINDDIDIYNSLPSNDPLKQRLNYGITDKRAKLKRLRGQHQLGYVGYHRLAGEVEARNAEKRLDMTEEERKNSLLVDTEDEGRDRQIVYGNAQPLPAANAKQSKSNSQLSAARFDLFDNAEFSISKGNRATIEGWLKNRNDLSDKERGAVIDYIDKLDNAQVQLATGKWFASGAIRIPEDMPKVEQAYKVAKKAKVDMLKYASPMELINANSEFKIKEARINPNDVKELKAARSIPQYGIEIFDVEDSKKGQQAMRKIINTHWGEDANPWCLLQGDGKGNLTEASWEYWNHYNAYPKKVAFKDGKLLAFSANDSEDVVWWDRNDECHEYIPIVGKVPNDRYGRSALMEIHENGQVDYSNYHIGSENKDGAYMLWSDGGELIQSGFYKDGKFAGWKQLGGYYEMHKDGESYYLDSNSYNDHYRVADANKLVYTKSISHSGTNEYTVKDWGGNGRENEHVTISKGKIISYQSKKVFFNENEIAKSYRVDDGDVKKIVNRLNTGKKEVTKDDVTYFLNADGTIEKEIHKIPYRSFYAVAYRRPDGNVQHIETIDNRGNRTGWVRYFYTTDGEKRTEPLDKLYNNGYPYNTKVIPSDRIEFDKKWINIDFIDPKDLNLAIEKTIKDADKYIESRAKVIVDEVESKVSKVGNIEVEVEQMKKRDIDALNQEYADYSIARGGKNLEDRLESKYTQTRLRAARELAGDDESALMILDDLEPQTLEEYVAEQLGANGRKLLWENGKFSKGLKAHLGVSENEKKTYRSIISKDGYPPEVLAEEIWKSMPEEFYERYTDQDVFNTILDLASSYTRKQLKDFVVNRRIDAVIEFARKQEEWDAAQEEMYLETLSEQERNAYLANKEEMERVDKMSKKERAEYYRQKQVEQMLGEMTPEERAEYEAKEQWRKDNAAAITSSFFAERRLDKADKIQKLKDEINKLIKETRATNKENSEKVKEIAKEMQTYIKENIPTETQGDMTRAQFEQVIKQLSTAITRKDLEKPMRMVEYIGANTNRRALTRQMRDLLKQGFKGMTPKGLVKAKNVDGATSRVLGLAKSLYESMGKQPLGSDLRALQTKVRGIKAELEDLNNANGGAFSEYVEQINAILKKSGVDRYEEMTKYYNELSDRQDVGEIQVSEVLEHINRMLPELFSIELVKEQRTQAKADSAMTTKEDLEQLKNNLEDKREKGILSEEDQAVLDNMAMYELMVNLQQRQLDIDGPGTSSIASQMAAKVREAKQYRDELDKYDDKQSGIAKNLKDNIKRVNAEMEELFVQRTQAQKEVNTNVAELLDNLKQLRDTGNSTLKEWSKNKQERETRIVNMANASFGKDARGYWSEVDRRGGWKRDFSNKINNLRLAALMSPALSFEYMVGVMDPRYYTNESPIYKQFIKGEDGLIKANDNFFEGLESFNNGINEAVERFINRNAMQSLKEYFNKGDRFATEIIPFEFEVKENVNGEVVTSIVHRDAEMTRGRAAKIYAWSRMADGMAKLKAHGVTDETLEVVKAFIGQDYMDFIDWVEDEYFPKLRREKYNPIYKKMYGISMAENEHYFPFETYKKDIRTEKELEQINSDNLGGGIVGNIIERKRNNARLDFTDESPDIFDAISNYGKEMEEWAAYAQVREDLKKVINNKQFKQHCDMLGTNYYNHFLDAARVASRLYNPQPSAPQLQSAAAKLQKVFASAAISLRVSTALKQLLSAPAFAVYSLGPAFHKELLKTASVIDVESAIKGLRELANGNKAEAKRLLLEENWVGHYNWCVQNLPSFRERVSKGGAGNPILEEKGWSKFSDDVQSVGMLPNRLVDAFTCSVGAKAIYEYAFNKYKKTYDEATAHNMAVTDAEIAFNSSQQSSNPVFLSPLQSSKEFWLRGIMNYKNSPIGYYRNGMKANIDLYRATKALFGKPKFSINGEEVGFESNGVNPAAKAAEAAAKSIMFNFFLNFIWNFGVFGIAGVSHTMMNNDNEDGNMLYTDEEFDKATGGNMGLAVFNAATQGIPWISGFASVSQTGQDYTPSILFSEMNNYLEQVNKEGFMSLATAQLLIDLGLKNALGVDPEVWGQIYRGAQGIMADRPMRTEDFMNLLASPRSAIAGVAKQKVGEYNNMQDYVNARIESEREIGINETMDLGKKLTGLRPLRKSKLDGYIDEYLADKIPDYRELANKPDEKAKEERMEESNAFKNLNTLVATVQHTEEKKKSSKKIDGNEETKDKVKKIRKAVNVIHKLYASGDASSAQRIADELERRLKRGYNENGVTLDDKLKNVDIYDSTGTTEQRGNDGFDTMFDRAMLGGFDGVYLGSKLD